MKRLFVKLVALSFGADKLSQIICIGTQANIPSGVTLRIVEKDSDTKLPSKGKTVAGEEVLSHVAY